MKILKLLEGLYQELKTFNENVEYFSCLKYEKKRNSENPMRTMDQKERIAIHRWINKQIEAKKISLDDLLVDFNRKRCIEKFLENETGCGTEFVRRDLSKALGFTSFDDLLIAYKQENKGGKK